DEVRAHVLAGRKLPEVWVPDLQTRDDREPVRLRLELAAQRTRIKNQIRNLVKRSQVVFPAWFTSSGEWSQKSMQWLRDVVSGEAGSLPEGLRAALSALVELYEGLSTRIKTLDKEVLRLSRMPRYA